MAITHTNVTVGTTPTLLCVIPPGLPFTPVIVNNNDNSTIFIGDSSITTSGSSQGLPVTTKVNQQIWLHGGDKLYAISAAGTTTGAITVLYSGL